MLFKFRAYKKRTKKGKTTYENSLDSHDIPFSFPPFFAVRFHTEMKRKKKKSQKRKRFENQTSESEKGANETRIVEVHLHSNEVIYLAKRKHNEQKREKSRKNNSRESNRRRNHHEHSLTRANEARLNQKSRFGRMCIGTFPLFLLAVKLDDSKKKKNTLKMQNNEGDETTNSHMIHIQVNVMRIIGKRETNDRTSIEIMNEVMFGSLIKNSQR